MLDVITIGAATRDVFLVSGAFQLISSPAFSTGKGECVALGTKIDVDDIHLSTGGGATNAAVTFAKLGFATGVVCKIGKDEPGQAVLADLTASGVQTDLVRVSPKENTAYSTLLTAKNGERSVLVYRGASKNLLPADVPVKKLSSNAFYVTSLGGKLDILKSIVATAKKNKAFVAVNPGHAELKQASDLKEILTGINILFVNLEEARLLAGQEGDAPTIGKLLAPMVETLVITDGAKGSYAFSQGQGWYARTSGAKSVSRAGAGDAFGSAFTSAILKGKTLEEALQIGTLNAESVIQYFGAKTGILKTWPGKQKLATVTVKRLR